MVLSPSADRGVNYTGGNRAEKGNKPKSICFPLLYAARQQKKRNILNRLMEFAFVSNLGNVEWISNNNKNVSDMYQ